MQTDKKIEYKGYLIENIHGVKNNMNIFYLKMEFKFQEINYYLMKILNQVSIIKNNVDYQLKIINCTNR
jgi:hypothetical protein